MNNEKEETIEVNEILSRIFVTVMAMYITGMLYPLISFYACGVGVVVVVIGMWLSHVYHARILAEKGGSAKYKRILSAYFLFKGSVVKANLENMFFLK